MLNRFATRISPVAASRFYATKIDKQLVSSPGKLPDDPLSIPFGTHFSDHMLTLKWTEEKGWADSAEIKPYGPFSLMPAANVFHYGQEVFEGMKSYTTKQGKQVLFRPDQNFQRFYNSCDRMRLPTLPVETGLELLKELLKIDRQFIPNVDGTSLYIRPTMIGTEACLGVKAASEALFFIITCPVGAYYKGGSFEPIKIWICDEYTRAAPRGTGEAKAGGNYAASLVGSENAKVHGCQQALWLDAVENSYVEEVGAMNIFFAFQNSDHVEIVTPPLGGTILPGITRKSLLQLAPTLDSNWKVVERRLTVSEITSRIEDGSLIDAFGAGTAAVVSPIGSFVFQGKEYQIKAKEPQGISKRLYAEMCGIYNGNNPDRFGWIKSIDE